MSKKRKKLKSKKKKVAKPVVKQQVQSAKNSQHPKKESAKKEKKPRFFNKTKKPKKEKKQIVRLFKFKKETVPAEKPALPSIKSIIREKIKAKLARDYRKPIIIIFSILGILIIFSLASFIITAKLSDKAMPKTYVADLDVGFLTVDEIQNLLIEKGKPFLESKMQIILDGKTQEFTPAELGITLDPRMTLQQIEFVKPLKTNIISVIQSLLSKREVPYYVSIDINAALKNIETKFNFAEKKSFNAYLTFDDNDALIVVPEKAGKTIDVRRLYQSLKDNAGTLTAGQIYITTFDDKPLVTKEKLESELDKIKETFKKKITLTYENFSWTIKLIDHVDWIKFDYKDTVSLGGKWIFPINLPPEGAGNLPASIQITRSLWMSINPDPFLAWVNEEVSPSIESEPQDVEIYKDEKGEIIINGKGENGRKIIKQFLISALEEAANRDIAEFTIPIKEQKGQVKASQELQDMGIKTLLSTGRSGFAGSPTNRIHNISVGINTYNGILIEPGETFSFNDHLGPVDASTGYRTELVIKAEGTVPEYGGGLCQVSSTMYRAALFAGLPIVERAPHSYAVSYYAQIYGYGMDATIYPGTHDLKFTNDTPGYILVQSYTDGSKAFYKFYGTDDGRTVTMDGPYTGGYHAPGPAVLVTSPNMPAGARKQVEIAHTGFNATWFRYITKNGETIKETISSAYRAIPAKILVGPSAEPEGEST